MALDINGYNTDFNAFVKFAQNSFVTNDKTAVAHFEVGGAPLGGRLIVAANPQFDKVGKFRNQIQKDLNNEIRTAFRNAIINMFGGEKNIPKSVQKAMLMSDYGKIILIGGLPFKGLEIEEFCKDLDEFVGKAEEWRETVENFRPAAEEAAVRDEEAAQFMKFGGNGTGFMSV